MKFQILDLESWPRRAHFQFFKDFDEPFFGIVVTVDATQSYYFCKDTSTSFFNFYLHKVLAAANAVENFRFRMGGSDVLVFDRTDASPTIMREDGTFGFGYVEFNDNFDHFNAALRTEKARVKSTTGLFTREFPVNIIHVSALPWLDFSAISHARTFGKGDSCPKISFGKLSPDPNGRLVMPMSVHVHHGLMDGLQVAQFVELVRSGLADPTQLLSQ